MMWVTRIGKEKQIAVRSALVLIMTLVLFIKWSGSVAYAQASPPVEVKPLPTPENVSIPPEVLQQIDADLASGQEVHGDGLGDPIKWIIQKVVTVTVQIPWQHVTNALSKIFSVAVGRDMGMFKSTQIKLHDLAVQVADAVVKKEELGVVGGKVAAATLGVAVPFFLLRLLIYHWRRLMGEPDDLLSVIGDWLTAGALAAMAPNIVVLALDTGLLISERAFGGALPDLMGAWVDSALSPFGNLVNLLALASEIGFMSVIGLFLMAILTVAAVATIIFIIAAVLAVSYLLVAIGPIALVMSVVPQMRWARSMWLKAVFLVGVTPIAIGVVYFTFFRVFMPPDVQGFAGAPTLESVNPFAFLTRLVWLIGATGFLLSVAGSIGRVGLGSAVTAINMSRRAVAAIGGLATAAITGGAALAVGGTAIAGMGGVKGMMGTAGLNGLFTQSSRSGGGGSVGVSASSPISGGNGTTTAPTTNPYTPSPGPSSGTSQPGSPPTGGGYADDMMRRAARARGAAMLLGMMGKRSLSGFFHLSAMNMERQAMREELRRRMDEDPGVHAPRVAEEMSQTLKQPVNDVTAKGILTGIRHDGGSVNRAMEGFRQLLDDWRSTGGTDKQLSDLMRARPQDVGRIVAAYQRGIPGKTPQKRLGHVRDVLTLGGHTVRTLAEREAWRAGGGSGDVSSGWAGPDEVPPAEGGGGQEQVSRGPEAAGAGASTTGGQKGPAPVSSLRLHQVMHEVQGDQGQERGKGTVHTSNVSGNLSSGLSSPRTSTATDNQGGETSSSVPSQPQKGGDVGASMPTAGAHGFGASLKGAGGGSEERKPPDSSVRTTVSTPRRSEGEAPAPPPPSTVTMGEGQTGQVPLGVKINDDIAIAYRRLRAPGQRLVADFAHFSPRVKGESAQTQMVIAHASHLQDAFPKHTEVLFDEYARARQAFPGNDAESVSSAWAQAKQRYGQRVYGDDWQEAMKRDPVILSLDGYMA